MYKRTSREHSIGSSFYGDTDSTNTEDIPAVISRPPDDWPSATGLGISEDISPPNLDFIHPGLPHLIHQNSTPSSLDLRTMRKQHSVEAVKAKRETLEKNAEFGDDEDEELGKLPSRARSPQGKPRGSKLGIEMMRTNSRGSVTSGSADEPTTMPNVTSNPDIDMPDALHHDHATIEPPEIFSREAKGDAVKVVDMDATPRPSTAAAKAAIENSSLPVTSFSPTE